MKSPRRIVTGHGPSGKAIVSIDDHCQSFGRSAVQPDLRSYEMWETVGMPVVIGNEPDPTLHPFRIEPAPNGSLVRIADLPPDTADLADPKKIAQYFESLGSRHASTTTTDSKQPHPLMHRTETVDYGIVISGHPTLVLDDSEVTLEPGDVVIQRGTNHAWSNRTKEVVRIAFVLLDGKFGEGLAGHSVGAGDVGGPRKQ